MKVESMYICDCCGGRFTMSYDRKPNHIFMDNYCPNESTVSYRRDEYDLCEKCANQIRSFLRK